MLKALDQAQRVIDKYNKNQQKNKEAFERAALKYGYITGPDGNKCVPIHKMLEDYENKVEFLIKSEKEKYKHV